MKLVLFTSNGIRHKYVTNTLSQNVDDTLVICECNQNDAIDEKEDDDPDEEDPGEVDPDPEDEQRYQRKSAVSR